MPAPSQHPGESSHAFGPFRLLPGRRTLLRDDAAVSLGSRALDVLMALVERPGEVVTKRELMARAWPDLVVGEGSLKVAVSELRQVLGDSPETRRYMVNVPGRGYMFVAAVASTATPPPDAVAVAVATSPPMAPVAPPLSVSCLPCLPFQPIGRESAVASIAEALRERRLVSIVGPGGMGKTTVAVVVAQTLAASFEDGACFVDLGVVSDARFVPAVVAEALGVTVRSDDPLTALAMALRQRRLLVVLDNCERVLDAIASLATRLLGSAPGMRLLATTREALRVAGETVYRLPPLAFPQGHEARTLADALAFPAVRLFVDRATIRDDRFEIADADVAFVADICGRLEGLPLAIELTASRVDAFSLRELAALLENRRRLIQMSWRSGPPRHASLSATLDWSHELLTPGERRVLRQLSVFSGDFTLNAARTVVEDGGDIDESLEGLVAKSLVSTSIDARSGRYRLLEATRAYAAQKLEDSGEHGDLRRRHAGHVLEALGRCDAPESTGEAPCIADVRAALAWANSPAGSPELAVALAIAALPMWTRQSLLTECRDNVERLLADDRPLPHLGPRERMVLKTALGTALLHTRGPRSDIAALWSEALATADELHDVEHQLRLLWGLPLHAHFAGDYRGALGYLRRFLAVARAHGDRVDRMNGERLLGTTLMYLGRLSGARRRAECMFSDGVPQAGPTHVARFQFEPVSMARGTLASVLWLQGQVDQAMRMAQAAVDDARRADHPLSLLGALGQCAVPLALHVGDWPAAAYYLDCLADLLARNDLALFGQHAYCLQSIALLERGDVAGVPLLEAATRKLLAAGFQLRRTHYLCALAKGLSLADRSAEALSTIDEALDGCERHGERWYLPEALRIKGELLAKSARSASALEGAAAWYGRALEMARAQGALTWELRAAMSLVRLRAGAADEDEAIAVLRTVRERFTEGFGTADLREAAALLRLD